MACFDLPRRFHSTEPEAHSGWFLTLEVVQTKSTYKKKGAITSCRFVGILAE